MSPLKRFEIIYPPIIKQHLKSIESKYYSLKFQSILEVAEQQIRAGQGLKHEDIWREIVSETAKTG